MTIEKIIELGVDNNSAEKVAEYFQREIDEVVAQHKAETEKLIRENENVIIGFEIEKALEKAGVWSEKAVRAMLDMENIRVENGRVTGLEEEIERVKNEYGILFKQNAVPRVVSCAKSALQTENNAVRSAMGI